MNGEIPLSHRLENNMRSLKKPVLSYFAYLSSPLNPRNKPTGKRIVDMHSLRQLPTYAGSRTRTPGMIGIHEPWDFRSTSELQIDQRKRPPPRQMVFSACYRPQIRVNIVPDRSQELPSERVAKRFRKPVPGSRCLSACLRGSQVCAEPRTTMVSKHASYSMKRVSPEMKERKLRREHPDISPRMRAGSNIGDILRKQWNSETIDHSSRSTTCSS